ncbi:sodium channel subunit beta-3 [Patagioenas fasciata monilis]|uniref:Sodium channel regulatory subunit beta-3 n=1 Tax=Patagioenas fasciata monilis TaxID=372326 RepID=A0A1V4J7C2_PATFA|nr:sodium channel subunit beta-3 [Patagioenas fasciata monilis]
MAALPRLVCVSSVVLVVWVGVCCAVCVEVPSETEAVQGNSMKLLCISCMKREEVTASTMVEWFYRPDGGKDEPIYEYRKTNHEFQSRFSGRIQWNGSKDMQDVSITVLNVTLNDSGIYTCNITREFEFEIHRPLFTSSRKIHLTVVEEAGEDFTSVISEIMMRRRLPRKMRQTILQFHQKTRKTVLCLWRNSREESAQRTAPRGSEDRRTVSRQPGLRGSAAPPGGNMGNVNSLLFALDSVQH